MHLAGVLAACNQTQRHSRKAEAQHHCMQRHGQECIKQFAKAASTTALSLAQRRASDSYSSTTSAVACNAQISNQLPCRTLIGPRQLLAGQAHLGRRHTCGSEDLLTLSVTAEGPFETAVTCEDAAGSQHSALEPSGPAAANLQAPQKRFGQKRQHPPCNWVTRAGSYSIGTCVA